MPDILRTEDVMRRYGCERHTAANIMRKLPVFKVGKRLFVKLDDLQRWEESLMEYPAIPIQHNTTITKIARRRT